MSELDSIMRKWQFCSRCINARESITDMLSGHAHFNAPVRCRDPDRCAREMLGPTLTPPEDRP